jgi:anti-sigma-K factor RskA
VGKDGVAEIVFHPKARITSAKAFAISLERKGGVPNVAGPIVLASK